MAKDPFAPSSTGELTKFDFAAEIRKANASLPRGQAVPGLAGLLEQGLRTPSSRSEGPMSVAKMLIDKRKADEAAGVVTLPAGTPQWATVQAQLPGFADLPYSQQKKAYDQYLETTAAALQKADPTADIIALQEQIRAANPEPAEPTRTTGEAISDVARGVGAGVAGLAGSFASALDPAGVAAAVASAGAQGLRRGMSATEQDRQRQVAFEQAELAADEEVGLIGRLLGEAGIELGNISAASLAELIGNVGPTLVGTAGVGLAARALRGAAGATEVAAAQAGQRAAMATGLATSAVLGGGDAAQQAYQTVNELPLEELQQYPEWQQALTEAGGDEAQARRAVATNAARIAQVIGSTTGLVFAAVPGSLEGAVARGVGRQAATGGLARAVGRRAGEAAVEGLDEAASQIAGNIGAGTVTGETDARSLLEGAGGSFALGAIGGVGGGLATAGLSRGAAVPGETPPPAGGIEDLVGGETEGSTIPAGTIQDIAGATLIAQPDGSWAYAEGAVPNPVADAVIAESQAAVVTAPPAEEEEVAPVEEIDEVPLVPVEEEITPVVEEVAPAEPAEEIAPVAPIEPTPVPAPSPEGQARAVQFDQEFTAALDRLKAGNPAEVASMTAALAPITEQLGTLSEDGNPIQALHEANNLMEQFLQTGRSTLSAARTALRRTAEGEIGPLDGSPLGYLLRNLGIGVRLAGASSATDPWARAARNNPSGQAVLEAMTTDPTVGLANQTGARELINAYQASGIPFPRVAYVASLPRNVSGTYASGSHKVTLSPNTRANSVVHEMLHGLTARGLYALSAQATAGDAQAQGYISLLAELRDQLRAASEGRRYYGANATYKGQLPAELSEMFAEMATPDFLALAAQTPVGSLSPEAQAALDSLNAQPGDSILDALVRLVNAVIRLVSPNAQVSENTIASALVRTAAESARATPQRIVPTAEGEQELAQVIEGQNPLFARTAAEAVAMEEGADNIVGDQEPHSPRESFTGLIDGVEAGEQAPASTDWRAFEQAAKRNDGAGMRTAAADFGDKVNEHLHDHLTPVKRWIQRLPISGALRDRLNDALYTAPVRRDNDLRIGMEQHGGLDVQKALGRMVDKYKLPAETVSRWAGYWITAQRAATGNARLIARDTVVLEEAQAALASGEGSQAAVDAATAQLLARIRAVNNPNPRVRTHGAGVAGFSNAQAAALSATIESKLNRTDLQALAEKVYDLNAWKLTLDIESGKVAPNVAAQFLDQPELQPLLEQLRDLAVTADANSPDSVLALEAKRREVMAATRSNYVPLTGRPDTALDADTFSVGSAAPNTAVDYRLEGRMTSIPDDALTATWASVLRSTNYAGWAPFQDAIAATYSAMSEDQRREAGLSRRTVENGVGAARPGENAIIRKRGNTVHAYTLADAKLLNAIRGSNVQDASHILPIIAKPVKWYSYAATQLNLFFAPVNYFRDAWERSELIRKAGRYHDAQGNTVDGTKLGRALLNYTLNPQIAADLLTATGRFGFKRPRANTRAALMLEEMLAAGGGSVWGDRFTSDRAEFVRGIMRQRGWSKKFRPIAEVIDAYNRTFDMAPALASYMALRDQGVAVDAAAAGALDLMNFRKRGASMGLFNSIYAFAQPALTGGANALGNLYDPRAPADTRLGGTGFTRRGVTRLIGSTLALGAIQAFARSLADDDEGGNKLDQVPDFTHNSNLVIPWGDGYIKIPLAFGLTRVANGMARNFIGATDGELTVADAFGKFTSGSLIPVFSPIEDVNVSWTQRPMQAFMLTFAPSWLKPVVSVGVNRTANDAPVVYDNYEKTDEYRSEQFGKRIPPVYQDIARFLRKTIGWDAAPEEVATLVKGYPMGSLSTLRKAVVENPYNAAKGKPISNPMLDRVYGVYSSGGKLSQFYDALEGTNEVLRKQGVGEDLSTQERKELAWRAAWDKTDAQLKAARRKINKLPMGEARERQARELDTRREREQVLAVYRYRQATGKKATIVNVPKQLQAQ